MHQPDFNAWLRDHFINETKVVVKVITGAIVVAVILGASSFIDRVAKRLYGEASPGRILEQQIQPCRQDESLDIRTNNNEQRGAKRKSRSLRNR